ncbi:MAG: flagellar protein FlaG [Pseudomonadota bacterium]
MLIDPNKLTPPPTATVSQASVQGRVANSTRVMPVSGLSEQAVAVSDTLPQIPGKTGDALEQGLKSPSPEALQRAVSEVKDYIQSFRRDLNLNYDDETGRLVIKVIDRDTEEVVRQIPSEEVLSFIHNMLRLGDDREGVLLKEKA